MPPASRGLCIAIVILAVALPGCTGLADSNDSDTGSDIADRIAEAEPPAAVQAKMVTRFESDGNSTAREHESDGNSTVLREHLWLSEDRRSRTEAVDGEYVIVDDGETMIHHDREFDTVTTLETAPTNESRLERLYAESARHFETLDVESVESATIDGRTAQRVTFDPAGNEAIERSIDVLVGERVYRVPLETSPQPPEAPSVEGIEMVFDDETGFPLQYRLDAVDGEFVRTYENVSVVDDIPDERFELDIPSRDSTEEGGETEESGETESTGENETPAESGSTGEPESSAESEPSESTEGSEPSGESESAEESASTDGSETTEESNTPEATETTNETTEENETTGEKETSAENESTDEKETPVENESTDENETTTDFSEIVLPVIDQFDSVETAVDSVNFTVAVPSEAVLPEPVAFDGASRYVFPDENRTQVSLFYRAGDETVSVTTGDRERGYAADGEAIEVDGAPGRLERTDEGTELEWACGDRHFSIFASETFDEGTALTIAESIGCEA